MQADFGEFEKGCVMHFTGASDQTSREDLKELFGQYGTISWVEFERGQTEASIHITRGQEGEALFPRAKSSKISRNVINNF